MATLNTFLDSVVSDEVECAICLSMLERPRILECLHSFCEKCLEKYLKSSKDDSSGSGKGNLKCAICCAHTTLPENGVLGLKLDYRATRLVAALREKETRKSKLVNSGNHCEVCGWTASVKASSTEDSNFTFCSDCCQVICKRCTTVHAGLRLTKAHEVAKISDLLAGKVSIKNKDHQIHCPKHVDEKLKIFCVTCLEPVCQDCTLSDHTQSYHELRLLKDYVPTIRKELSSRQAKVSKKYDEFTDFLNSVQKLRNDIIDNAKERNKAIEKASTELNRRVKKTQLQMEKEAQDILDDKENQLEQLMKKTEHMRSLADKSLSMSRKLLENKEDVVGLSSMYKDLNQAMYRTLNNQRFIIATTDAKLYILGDKLDQIDDNLPNGRNISGLATDSADNIYITDRDNHKIYVLRSSGTLKDTIDVKDISPTCIAVPYIEPDLIAVLHEPATVSIIDHSGKALRSIHGNEWKQVAIGCDADRLLYVLWSGEDTKRTLERYSFQGLKVDTLFQGESHSCNSLILAVPPTGDSAAAVVTKTDVDALFNYQPPEDVDALHTHYLDVTILIDIDASSDLHPPADVCAPSNKSPSTMAVLTLPMMRAPETHDSLRPDVVTPVSSATPHSSWFRCHVTVSLNKPVHG
nr:E3 ubiquitin-protein ligase TRIM31-like [Lytechinus pictus]